MRRMHLFHNRPFLLELLSWFFACTSFCSVQLMAQTVKINGYHSALQKNVWELQLQSEGHKLHVDVLSWWSCFTPNPKIFFSLKGQVSRATFPCNLSRNIVALKVTKLCCPVLLPLQATCRPTNFIVASYSNMLHEVELSSTFGNMLLQLATLKFDYIHDCLQSSRSCSTLRIGPYLFYIAKFITQFKTEKKMIGNRTPFRENGDLPPWRGSAAKKKPPFFNARALMTREIMRSRDAHCNTEEWP